MTQALALNELPAYSHWPARLLGEVPFSEKQRNPALVDQEYEQDKWGRMLLTLQAYSDELTIARLLELQGLKPDERIPYSVGETLYLGSHLQVYMAYEDYLADVLTSFKPTYLVELGSGLGDKILRLAQRLNCDMAFGGEYTKAGVECGKILATQWGIDARFEHVNYHQPQTLHWLPEQAVVFTSHSIEQIPTLQPDFVEALLEKRPKAVLHVEPHYEAYTGDTLISLMRKRYIEVNDYNRNLHTCLSAFADVGSLRILKVDSQIPSVNPMNPSTAILWQPCES
ncbi:MAG TPA: hypothetical protein V6C99_12155 [Oculatellaceae cyanobacterium]